MTDSMNLQDFCGPGLDGIVNRKNIMKHPIISSIPPFQKPKRLLAVTRDLEGKAQPIESDTAAFKSERQLEPNPDPLSLEKWRPERVMAEVPLYISNEQVSERKTTADYSALPKDLDGLLNEGILRTSGSRHTNYSVLMSATVNNEGRPPEGRTGILLHNHVPVIVSIDGKDFVVEAKGVGCPDGKNRRSERMHRRDYFGMDEEEIGGFDIIDGEREFANLETQRRRGVSGFASGDAVRALALITYLNPGITKPGEGEKNLQAYLLRLAPTNIRASYNSNPDFPQVNDRDNLLSTSIGRQYAELAKLEEILLHTTIHPENMVWTGARYVLTDFADCRRLSEIHNPHHFLNFVLSRIEEVPEITEAGVSNFYATVAGELGVSWDQKTGYEGFIDAIWAGYFAQKVYRAWEGNDSHYGQEIKSVQHHVKMYSHGKLIHWAIKNPILFLEVEIDMLQHVDEAAESLKIARERVAYLKTQLDDPTDITAKFVQDPDSYFGLYILPYMQRRK